MKQKLLLICVLLMAAFSAHAYYDFYATSNGKKIYYNIKGNGTTVFVTNPNAFSTASDNYAESIVIPEKVSNSGKEYTVTGIETGTFTECTRLTSITVPGTITSIDAAPFYGCTALTTFDGPYASSDHRSLVMDGNLIAFAPSGITSYSIPSTVTAIGASSFVDCTKLTSITIPNSVTSIGESAFSGCTSLSTLTFSSNSSSKLITIGKSAFSGCSALTSMTIPSTVTTIGQSAFYYCSGLTSVTIPNSVTSIDGYAFSYCTALSSITTRIQNPQNVSMGSGVFTSVPTGTCVLNVPWDSGAAYRCADQWKSFGNIQEPGITTEGLVYTLNDDGNGYTLSGFTDGLPANVVLPSLNEGKPITSIGANAFKSCTTLKSIKLSSSVTSIESSAFSSCTGLESISISPSVNNIENYAFSGCSGLTSVTIPNSVTSIGYYAFSDCSGLTSVTIPNSVISIGDSAFEDCSGLASVTIGNSVISIGNSAFASCDGLTSVTIPDSVTSIGDSAFKYCSGLTSVTIPNSVTSIGERAFFECLDLTSVTIPESVTSIGDNAFSGCIGLKSFYGKYSSDDHRYLSLNGSLLAFAQNGLTSYDIPDSITSIGTYAFYGCIDLISVTIPNSITAIGECAFFLCKSLTSVTIPSSVTTIGNSAFSSCFALTTIKSEITDLDNLSVSPSAFSKFLAGPYSTRELSVPRLKQSVYASTVPWSDFTNIVEHFITGDANIDYKVNSTDVAATVSHIMGTYADDYDTEAADVNGNGKVNVADVTLITKIILNEPISSSQSFAPARAYVRTKSLLTLTDVNLATDLNASLILEDAQRFVALQFEMFVPEGLVVENITANGNFQVAMRDHGDGIYRVIAYSTDGTTFPADAVLNFQFVQTSAIAADSVITFDNVLANENVDGHIFEHLISSKPALVFDSDEAVEAHIDQPEGSLLGLRLLADGVEITVPDKIDIQIATLHGMTLTRHLKAGVNRIVLTKGIYIINGIKVII